MHILTQIFTICPVNPLYLVSFNGWACHLVNGTFRDQTLCNVDFSLLDFNPWNRTQGWKQEDKQTLRIIQIIVSATENTISILALYYFSRCHGMFLQDSLMAQHARDLPKWKATKFNSLILIAPRLMDQHCIPWPDWLPISPLDMFPPHFYMYCVLTQLQGEIV